MNLLSLHSVSAFYGASQALFDVDLEIREGEVVALMGRNGVGKTTTVRAICRMLPSYGTLVFDGHDLSRLPSHRAARLGIGLVPEGRRCFGPLGVAENLTAAARPGHWDLGRVYALFPRLGERVGQKARSLSGGEQQMLAIGRALMTNPRLLILDEATEGLAPKIRQEIWQVVAELGRQTSMAILIVDKSLAELRTVCESATILNRGATAWAGPFRDITPQISEPLLGVS